MHPSASLTLQTMWEQIRYSRLFNSNPILSYPTYSNLEQNRHPFTIHNPNPLTIPFQYNKHRGITGRERNHSISYPTKPEKPFQNQF